MAYDNYKKIQDLDGYFKSWKDQDQVKQLSEKLKREIYHKYVIKCKVFQRDKFRCQNEDCPFCKNQLEHDNLTMHHIKFRKNDGQDKERNCVTLCLPCHRQYHRGKGILRFWGQKWQIHVDDETVNWKQVTRNNKQFRKKLFMECPELKDLNMSDEDIIQLIKFLFVHYKDLIDDYDDEW